MSSLPDETLRLIRTRRTVQLFKPDPVPHEVLLQALEAARWAPNHRLTEPWRFYSIGPDTKSAIVDLNARLVTAKRGAEAGQLKRERWSVIPGWLVVTSVLSDDPFRRREDYAACCCAVQNLMLYLWSEGVATKWTTGDVTRDDAFYRIVQIPQGEEVVAMLWYGYPHHQPKSVRRPVADVLHDRP